MQTRYAAGPGVLLAAPRRWLLLAQSPGPDALEQLWRLLNDGVSGDDLVGEVLHGLGGGADAGAPPAAAPDLVLVDLGADAPVTRGAGRVTVERGVRRLSVGLVAGAGPLLPLVGGAVAASLAELTPAPTHRPTLSTGGVSTVTAPPAGAGVLIDGIPPEILAASAPDREPGHWRTAAETQDPQPDEEVDSDHDGTTVYRAHLVEHLRQTTRETVLALRCRRGHLTPADELACRVCGDGVATGQEPRRIPRPTLGGLRLPTGEVVPLDREVVLGRRPTPVAGADDWPHLVHLPQESTYLSRQHLQIELDGWLVLARDLGSRAGTTLRRPGRDPESLRSGESVVLEPGYVLDLAEVYQVTYEVVG